MKFVITDSNFAIAQWGIYTPAMVDMILKKGLNQLFQLGINIPSFTRDVLLFQSWDGEENENGISAIESGSYDNIPYHFQGCKITVRYGFWRFYDVENQRFFRDIAIDVYNQLQTDIE